MADKMDAVTALAETLESVFPISMRRPPTRSDLDGMLAGLKLRGYRLTPIALVQGELRERWAEKLYEAGLSPDFEPAIRWPNLSPAVRQLFFDMTDTILSDLAAQGLRVVPDVPVAWRVKDFADGWILFNSEIAAIRQRSKTGAWLQPLYAPTTEPGSE